MKLCVVGTGYVGLVTGACLSRVGHEVAAVEISEARLREIRGGRPPFHEPGLPELIRTGMKRGRFSAGNDLASAMEGARAVFLAVGTPSLSGGGIDLGAIKAAAAAVGKNLRGRRPYTVVIVKSTVVPGTTEGVVLPILEKSSGRRLGAFGLAMNPEFLREGSAVEDFMRPDRIVIGAADKRSAALVASIYRPFRAPKLRTTPANAELIKYASNSLLASLISFSNEIADLAEATPSGDCRAVMEALHLDRRLSPVLGGRRISPGILSYLIPGPGFGGSCLPKDVSALRAYGRSRRVPTPLLDAVLGINRKRAAKAAARLAGDLGSLKGKRIAVFGLAFKAGTDDLRDSPGLALVSELLAKGASVAAYDPLLRAAAPGLDIRARLVRSPEAALAGADAVVAASNDPAFRRLDWKRLIKTMRRPLVFDARGALAGRAWPRGTEYLATGAA